VQLRDVFVILRDGWRTIAACLLVVVGATAVVTMTIPPTYNAYARVYLTVSRPADATRGTQATVSPVNSNDLRTLAEQIYTPIVQEPLRQRSAPASGASIGVSVTVPENSAWLDIVATSSDPATSARVANATGPVLADVAEQFAVLLSPGSDHVQAVTISPAVTPGSQSSPDVRRNLLLGVLSGLALGIGAALARHALDNKVRTEDDLEAVSDRPLLAQIPHDSQLGGTALAFESDPHGHHAESIRRLRTNLMFVDVTTGRHSFVFTSPMPGEGKTTTVVNLARAIADAGSRVLVIDGDLRNPSVAKTLGLEGSVGLTTVLLGRAALHEVIQPWGDSGFFVLPAGQIPPNPSELLGSAPMAELMEKLSADFDFVLFDSPPLVPVIDAVLLHRLTGGLVLVVAAERSRKKDLGSALTSLRTVDIEPAGFVLNFVPQGSRDPYRYGYYRYDSATRGGTRRGSKQARQRTTPQERAVSTRR
jgi:capsular exopolysaccharide synthesis family protein